MAKQDSPENIPLDEFLTEPPGFHMCLVVKDREKTMQALSSILGIGPWLTMDLKFDKEEYVGEPPRSKFAIGKLEGLGLGRLCLEILQPVEGTNYDNYIKTRGEGIHHLAIMVKNWEEVVEKIEKNGGKKFMSASTPEGVKFCYFEINPGGLILEVLNDKMPDYESLGATVRSA